jgi:hypothetical protein
VLKRAFAVGYVGLILYFLVTLLVAMLSPQPAPKSTSALILGFGLALSLIAYLLVRRNERVTIERRAALLAALLVTLGIVVANMDDVVGSVAGAFVVGSGIGFLVFSLAVTIHVLAHLVASILRRAVAG